MADSAQDQLVLEFMNLTQTEEPFARSFLESTQYNLAEAVELFLGGTGGFAAPSNFQRPTSPPPQYDAAEGVRAPILQKRARLFDLSPGGMVDEDDDDDDDDGGGGMRQANVARQTHHIQAMQYAMNIMNQVAPVQAAAPIFRQNASLVFPGSFEQAREQAKRNSKWLLVSIQDYQEFQSVVENRDLWAHEMIVDYVRAGFVFWQRSVDTDQAQRFMALYKPQRPFPFTAILDARTGEQVAVLKLRGTEDDLRVSCMEQLTSFLDSHSLDSKPKSVPRAPPAPPTMGSDDDLAKAIAASLASSPQPRDEIMEDVQQPPSAAVQPLLLPEPAEGSESCRVKVKMPDGSTKSRRFAPSSPVAQVFSFVAAELGHARFELQLAMPNAGPLSALLNESILAARVANAVIVVRLL